MCIRDRFGEASFESMQEDESDIISRNKLDFKPTEATAAQVMQYLAGSNRYAIGTEYDDAMAYKITVVRFSMAQNAYQKYIATTIATNVSEESVAYISEHAAELQGVEVLELSLIHIWCTLEEAVYHIPLSLKPCQLAFCKVARLTLDDIRCV